ncbi:hypothetical protein PPL_04117 [Heterostelium album PN500]|uniref:Uncharacterized protein n=1 Tax=Heterostelium pallidum (strain ATCC 26659 / Pp 5 / PN500) TaxID=670386 RepID=D3B627_HETP5|nr:hypothetical protein PPL_04117 [Heterostelium album PN500]EFA83325.1 hypothetical protein PPL_04117 [Heterostelium album PN500]|eukprot:XP_020435442.1 hypothetical protein PPL_04117 [Heterostelium album PN500]
MRTSETCKTNDMKRSKSTHDYKFLKNKHFPCIKEYVINQLIVPYNGGVHPTYFTDATCLTADQIIDICNNVFVNHDLEQLDNSQTTIEYIMTFFKDIASWNVKQYSFNGNKVYKLVKGGNVNAYDGSAAGVCDNTSLQVNQATFDRKCYDVEMAYQQNIKRLQDRLESVVDDNGLLKKTVGNLLDLLRNDKNPSGRSLGYFNATMFGQMFNISCTLDYQLKSTVSFEDIVAIPRDLFIELCTSFNIGTRAFPAYPDLRLPSNFKFCKGITNINYVKFGVWVFGEHVETTQSRYLDVFDLCNFKYTACRNQGVVEESSGNTCNLCKSLYNLFSNRVSDLHKCTKQSSSTDELVKRSERLDPEYFEHFNGLFVMNQVRNYCQISKGKGIGTLQFDECTKDIAESLYFVSGQAVLDLVRGCMASYSSSSN